MTKIVMLNTRFKFSTGQEMCQVEALSLPDADLTKP